MFEGNCKTITDLSDVDIWAFYEAEMPTEKATFIRSHVIDCIRCLEHFAKKTQTVTSADERRYNRFHQEVMAVRRAELLRSFRKVGIELDVLKIKTPQDYFKYGIGSLSPNPEAFFKFWDTLSDSERDSLMFAAVKITYKAEMG